MSILDLNDNCVTLTGLFNKVSQTYENTATATVSITTAAGAPLVTAQSMPYITSSDGIYQAIIASTIDLGNDGEIVIVSVTATTGAGNVYHATGSVYVYDRQLAGTA